MGGDRKPVGEEEDAGARARKGAEREGNGSRPCFVTSLSFSSGGGSERARERRFLCCWSLAMKLSGLNPSWQLVLFLHFAVKQMTLRWHFHEDFIRLTHTASAGG